MEKCEDKLSLTVKFNSTMSTTDDQKDVIKEVRGISRAYMSLFTQFKDYEFK